MTQKEVLEKTGFTRQHLHALMHGSYVKKKGERKFIPPKLIEGVDYISRKLEFFPSALEKINKEK